MKEDKLKDPEVRQLYLMYLGTLNVLGTLASKCNPADVGMVEEVAAVMDDASTFLDGRILFRPTGRMGYHMDVIDKPEPA
jgi:hypothetical protein